MFSLAGYSVYCPAMALAECRRRHITEPPNFSRANSFTCSLGGAPGRGWLLMLRADLDRLQVGSGQDEYRALSIALSSGTAITLPKILLTGQMEAVHPGADGDQNTLYVVEIADRRWLEWERGERVHKAYNCRADADGEYLSATLNSGTAWTWAQLLSDLWPSGLGTVPTLPFTPHGTPGAFIYAGETKLRCVDHVLTRMGCALKYDPVGDSFTIVRIGETDDTATQLLTRHEPYRIHDNYTLIPRTMLLPETVTVQFCRRPLRDGVNPYYTTNVTVDPAAGPVAAGTVVLLRDDMVVLCDDTGTPTDVVPVEARRDERAADYIRWRRYFDRGELRLYTGGWGLHAVLGARWDAVSWRDVGTGLITEVASGDPDDDTLESWWRHEAQERLVCRPDGFDATLALTRLSEDTVSATPRESQGPCCPGYLGDTGQSCCDILGGPGDGGGGENDGGYLCYNACGDNTNDPCWFHWWAGGMCKSGVVHKTIHPNIYNWLKQNPQYLVDCNDPRFQRIPYPACAPDIAPPPNIAGFNCGNLCPPLLPPPVDGGGGGGSGGGSGGTGGGSAQCWQECQQRCGSDPACLYNCWRYRCGGGGVIPKAGSVSSFQPSSKSSGCSGCGSSSSSAAPNSASAPCCDGCASGHGCDGGGGYLGGSILGGSGLGGAPAPDGSDISTEILTGESVGGTLASDTHDWSPSGGLGSVITFSSTGSNDLTGMEPGPDGSMVTLIFTGGGVGDEAVLKTEDAGSTADNRFELAGNLSLTMDSTGHDSRATFVYASSRWRLISYIL